MFVVPGLERTDWSCLYSSPHLLTSGAHRPSVVGLASDMCRRLLAAAPNVPLVFGYVAVAGGVDGVVLRTTRAQIDRIFCLNYKSRQKSSSDVFVHEIEQTFDRCECAVGRVSEALVVKFVRRRLSGVGIVVLRSFSLFLQCRM